jgi:hypothetical protein
MAITTEAVLYTAIQNGVKVRFHKASTSGTTGGFFTLWRIAGRPGAGATPTTTGLQLSRASAGAMLIPPPSGISYLAEFEAAAQIASQTVILCDRLVEYAGLDGTVTTAQSVSALALPSRATGATDVELWLEMHTAVGATPSPTVTASYTNQSGTSGRTATLIGGLAAVNGNRCYPFSLQVGDTGVQSVQSFTSTTSTGTAGSLGLTLRRSLVQFSVPQYGINWYWNWSDTALVIIPDDAALELVNHCTGGNGGGLMGSLRIAQG